MRKRHNKLVVVALLGATVFAAWKLGGALFSAEEAKRTDRLTNRVWIDHMPADARDMTMHLTLVDHRQGQFGAVGQSSQWRHFIEVFMWRLKGKQLTVMFPQDHVQTTVRVKTWRCAGEAPIPFELCLRITDPQHDESIMLYSRDDWEIDPNDAEGSVADLIEAEPNLAGVIRALAVEPNAPGAHFEGAENWSEQPWRFF